jgi:hypothetical protein
MTIYSRTNHVQAGLVLRDFALTSLENLHHFSNLSEKFCFNALISGKNGHVTTIAYGSPIAQN